ncbi:serine hydrolase [Salipaludibacillus aurantiacus]|uniref:CubicO group peptidase, beta-lactamase class C family n=1 Tax=Salipaludibacillus aurantiacus TaxID=1601833 RepID=A0A1H9Q9K7_9BACI|nr:serine hydrolase [Salipaludibacillus aurantiacus]SER56569.1 CubicO group peptidase, beta-lactamase class C family [Salipaludibacillus aurantiacus]
MRIIWSKHLSIVVSLALFASLFTSETLIFAEQNQPPHSIEEDYLHHNHPSSLPAQVPAPEWAKAWERAGKANLTLKKGSPSQVHMQGKYLEDIDEIVQRGIEENKYPGAVAMIVKDGRIIKHEAYGKASKYKNDSEVLPEEYQLPMEKDTIFDLASLTKIVTSIAVMQLTETDEISLHDTLASYIPEFGTHGKDEITIEQLLTHTSGLAASHPLDHYETEEERLQALYDLELTEEPGTTLIYSDLSMILLGLLVETVSGETLDEYVSNHITGPLGMTDTMFNPSEDYLSRVAPTEHSPWSGREMVWGTVHDEKAYAMDGVAGHAGLFSTTEDFAILSQMILNGGRYGNARILEPGTVAQMLTNQITDESHLGQGLGFNLNRGWFMDGLSSPVTAGHTGFTGTSFVIDPRNDTVVIFFTNRVHPTRYGPSINPERQDIVRQTARALPVRPAAGQEAWFSGNGRNKNHTLTLPVTLEENSELTFKTWIDIADDIPRDFGYLDISVDEGETWHQLDGHLHAQRTTLENAGIFTGSTGWRWVNSAYDLSEYSGDALIRFSYVTDGSANGRGWYIDQVTVTGNNGHIFKDRPNPDINVWQADGWELSSD